MLALASFVLGTIGGSFINALSFRWGTGVSILTGRSRCMRCGHTLHAVDLVPIFSWAFLRGRCRYCGAKISWQYPLVELLAGLFSLAAYLAYPAPVAYFFALAISLTLLFIAVYDLRHKIIPTGASLFLMVLVLLNLALTNFNFFALLAGVILASPLYLISLFSGGRWMGWGDGTLELSLGWLLGLTAGLTALCLAFWSGALVGIGALMLRRGVTMKSEVPFAPFLIAGALAAFFFHVDIFATLPSLLL